MSEQYEYDRRYTADLTPEQRRILLDLIPRFYSAQDRMIQQRESARMSEMVNDIATNPKPAVVIAQTKRDELAEALNNPFYTWNGSGPNHVEDAARAFLRLLDGTERLPKRKDENGDAFNSGWAAYSEAIRAIIGEEWFATVEIPKPIPDKAKL